MLGFFSSEAMGTCSFCTSGLYHAGVLAPFPGGLGLEVPSQLLSCLLWGQAAQWVCTHQHLAPVWLQLSWDKLLPWLCDTRSQGSCSPSPGRGLWHPRAQWLPGHIPSGRSISVLNAKKAPTPNPRSPHESHSAYLLPKRTRKPWGPGQFSPPHWEQGCAAAPRTMGDCPGTATPVAAPCQEQTGNKGSAIGECWDPSLLFALERSRSRGSLLHPGQRCSQPRWDPLGRPCAPSRVLGQTCLFWFYFWPPGRWLGGARSGTANSSIPRGLRVPGCSRAWQAPCHSPSCFGKLQWGSLGRGKEGRKSPCAAQSLALYPGSAAASAKQCAAGRRSGQGASSTRHPREQSTPGNRAPPTSQGYTGKY